MKSSRAVILVSVCLWLIIIGVRNVRAQTNATENFFSAEYGGVSIGVNASEEAIPDGNITITVVIHATADGVRIENMTLDVYGFSNGRELTLLSSSSVMVETLLQFNETRKFDNTIVVPAEVWGMTYGEISLRYSIKDLPSTERNPGFPLTTVRNLHLENLENQLQGLNQSHNMLLGFFKKLTTEYAQLDATYTGLLEARVQDSNDLYGTRTVATILVVTTVFFVATTFYLMTQRPKDYW